MVKTIKERELEIEQINNEILWHEREIKALELRKKQINQWTLNDSKVRYGYENAKMECATCQYRTMKGTDLDCRGECGNNEID